MTKRGGRSGTERRKNPLPHTGQDNREGTNTGWVHPKGKGKDNGSEGLEWKGTSKGVDCTKGKGKDEKKATDKGLDCNRGKGKDEGKATHKGSDLPKSKGKDEGKANGQGKDEAKAKRKEDGKDTHKGRGDGNGEHAGHSSSNHTLEELLDQGNDLLQAEVLTVKVQILNGVDEVDTPPEHIAYKGFVRIVDEKITRKKNTKLDFSYFDKVHSVTPGCLVWVRMQANHVGGVQICGYCR